MTELLAGPVPGDVLVADIVAWAQLHDGPHCVTWAGWSVDRWAPVLVKLPPVEGDGVRARAALRREAGHLARLLHPGLPRLFGADLDGSTPYVVVELIEGETLAAMIGRSPFGVGDTVRLGLQLTSALRYLHGLGLAHLDLKPDNVIVRSGRTVIIDFGAAQAIGEEQPSNPRGTDGYMSPEQIAGLAVSESMDLWSLGALFYECLTGTSAAERSGRVPWRTRRKSPALFDLTSALLETEPEHRPANAACVLAELSALEGRPDRGWAPLVVRPHLPDAHLDPAGSRATTAARC